MNKNNWRKLDNAKAICDRVSWVAPKYPDNVMNFSNPNSNSKNKGIFSQLLTRFETDWLLAKNLFVG